MTLERKYSGGHLDGFFLMSFKENSPLTCELVKQRLVTLSILDGSVFRVRNGGKRRGSSIQLWQVGAPHAAC